MNIDADRAVLGLATTFGTPSLNDGRIWYRHHFQRFLDLEIAVPLRLEHGALISSAGAIRYIGTARYFQAVTEPADGLLALAELDSDPVGFGDQVLRDLDTMINLPYLPPGWGFSIGANVTDDLVVPFEISLTQRPAHPDARILAVGPRAITSWELLTESRTVAERR